MDLVRSVLNQRGTGLHNACLNRPELLPDRNEPAGPQLTVATTAELSEPATYSVFPDGPTGGVPPQPTAAVLKCGELHPYTKEEAKELKATEFNVGKAVYLYTGTFKQGTEEKEGKGTYFLANGDVFDGMWHNNARCGLGAVYSTMAYAYEGEFKDDVPCGQGNEYFASGACYTGSFRDGRPHGHGTMYYPPNGSVYQGEWSRGEKHGRGTIWYENGDVFEGMWVGGRRTGNCVSTHVFSNAYKQQRAADEELKRALRDGGSKTAHRVASASTTDRANVVTGGSSYFRPGDADDLQAEEDSQSKIRTPGDTSTVTTVSNRWHRDRCDFFGSRCVPRSNEEVRSLSLANLFFTGKLTPCADLKSRLDCKLGEWRLFSEHWNNPHQVLIMRIRRSFDAIDMDCSGSIPLVTLEAEFDEFYPSSTSTLVSIKRAVQASQQSLGSGSFPRSKDRAEFVDVLCGLFPHISSLDLKRRVQTHLSPEQLLRLRGRLECFVLSPRDDGFSYLHQMQRDAGVVSGDAQPAVRAPARSALPSSTAVVDRLAAATLSPASRGAGISHARTLSSSSGVSGAAKKIGSGWRSDSFVTPGLSRNVTTGSFAGIGGKAGLVAASGRVTAGVHGGKPKAEAPPADSIHSLSVDNLILSRASIGGFRLSRSALMYHKQFVADGGDLITFPQILALLFPMVPSTAIAHVEETSISEAALQGYRKAFSQLDDSGDGSGAIHVAALIKAQNAYSMAASNGEPHVLHPKGPLEAAARRGVWISEAVWRIADIDLTVSMAQSIDYAKCGLISLADILRYSYPNVPCLFTKERIIGCFTSATSQNAGAAPGFSGATALPSAPLAGVGSTAAGVPGHREYSVPQRSYGSPSARRAGSPAGRLRLQIPQTESIAQNHMASPGGSSGGPTVSVPALGNGLSTQFVVVGNSTNGPSGMQIADDSLTSSTHQGRLGLSTISQNVEKTHRKSGASPTRASGRLVSFSGTNPLDLVQSKSFTFNFTTTFDGVGGMDENSPSKSQGQEFPCRCPICRFCIGHRVTLSAFAGLSS